MRIVETPIPDVKVIYPDEHVDNRGSFLETYHSRKFAAHGIDVEFVQDNHSVSVYRGTIRGLHFQKPPFAQDKLVRVVRGAVIDVAVDLRPDSPTFRKHVSVRISADERNQIFIPAGFAHGFCTLMRHTEVVYKVSNFYSPAHAGGVIWNDPDLAIHWPVHQANVVLSEQDRRLPRLRDIIEDPKFLMAVGA